jgi:2'-5' RNA ligase
VSEPAPLILTLLMDEASFARLDGERRQHFPPTRNFIPAHVTLFHHLPGAHLDAVAAELATVSEATAPFSVAVTGLRLLGRGVAYRLDSPVLAHLRAGLAARFADWLTPQDAQRFQPHVTIQNKADPAQARALLATLEASFQPWKIGAEGLQLWHYRGGPWEPAGTWRLGG